MALQFVNAHGSIEAHDLYLVSGAGNLACAICEYTIRSQWYRSVGDEYNICSTCFVTYVQPISNNKLDVTPVFMNHLVYPNVNINVYNWMRHSLCSDLRGVGVTCNMCKRPNRGTRWAYVNTYNSSVYACHIRCVVQRIGANQGDDRFNYETNPFWTHVGRLSLVAFRELAANLVPPPFNSALSIILMLRAYQAHTRT